MNNRLKTLSCLMIWLVSNVFATTSALELPSNQSTELTDVLIIGQPGEADTIIPIMPNGQVNVPYIGLIDTSGKTQEQLTQELNQRVRNQFSSPYLSIKFAFRSPSDPQIGLHLQQFHSSRFSPYRTFSDLGSKVKLRTNQSSLQLPSGKIKLLPRTYPDTSPSIPRPAKPMVGDFGPPGFQKSLSLHHPFTSD